MKSSHADGFVPASFQKRWEFPSPGNTCTSLWRCTQRCCISTILIHFKFNILCVDRAVARRCCLTLTKYHTARVVNADSQAHEWAAVDLSPFTDRWRTVLQWQSQFCRAASLVLNGGSWRQLEWQNVHVRIYHYQYMLLNKLKAWGIAQRWSIIHRVSHFWLLFVSENRQKMPPFVPLQRGNFWQKLFQQWHLQRKQARK